MIQNYSDVLPLRIYSPADELAFYSSNGTGLGGRFVVLETGNNNPELSAGDFSAATPGYNYQGVTNLRYENKRKFKYAPSGSTKYNTLGVVLYGTVETDNNDLKLLAFPHRKDELMVVVSGETNNILTDGVLRLKSSAYNGVPVPGHVGIIGEAGKLQIIDPALLTATGAVNHTHIVAKVISQSGTAASFGGYADFKLMLK